MQLDDIFLAKFADLTPDGLFTVVGGGVNRIKASSFPWAWGLLFLLARIRLTVEEAQQPHTATVERVMPNGRIEPIATESPLTPLVPIAEVGPDGKIGLAFNFCLMSILFPEAGVYRYTLRIDGQELGSTELLVTGSGEREQGQ